MSLLGRAVAQPTYSLVPPTALAQWQHKFVMYSQFKTIKKKITIWIKTCYRMQDPVSTAEPYRTAIISHLHVLQKGSKIEERHLDRSVELCLCCVQQLFKGRYSLQMIFSPLLQLTHTGILQWRDNTNKVIEFRDITFNIWRLYTVHIHTVYAMYSIISLPLSAKIN